VSSNALLTTFLPRFFLADDIREGLQRWKVRGDDCVTGEERKKRNCEGRFFLVDGLSVESERRLLCLSSIIEAKCTDKQGTVLDRSRSRETDGDFVVFISRRRPFSPSSSTLPSGASLSAPLELLRAPLEIGAKGSKQLAMEQGF
jgi:hypothetical protein